MPETVVDLTRLAERVRAAAWMVPAKETRWRRLETRSREQFNRRLGWMVPIVGGTAEVFAVELVPCDPGDLGAVSLRRHHSAEQIRLDTEVVWELWLEEVAERSGAAE